MNTTKTPAQLFRKKPVVVEAVQFTEAVRDAHLFDGYPLPDGVVRRATHLHPPTRKVWRATFYIETLEGRMSVEVGDWIITGVKGEHYPCKPDIFAATYEEAQSAEPVAQAVESNPKGGVAPAAPIKPEVAQAMAAEYQELMAHMDSGGDYFKFMAKRQHPDGVETGGGDHG